MEKELTIQSIVTEIILANPFKGPKKSFLFFNLNCSKPAHTQKENSGKVLFDNYNFVYWRLIVYKMAAVYV